jgi:outer membrane protein TolC
MHRVPKSKKGPLCACFSQLAFLLMCTLLQLPAAQAQTLGRAMSLPEAVDNALTANLEIKKSHKEIEAAEATKKAQRTFFFPTFNATYQAVRTDQEGQLGGFVAGLSPIRSEYNLTAGFSQPLFQGFALLNQYQIADLGLDVAMLNRKLSRLQVIFLAKEAYFQVLKAEKLRQVAADSVKVLESQVEVARNFYEVGMTPLNDLLQTQVELANSRQELIVAQNNLNVAQSQFNIVLQRPVNAPVTLADIQTFTPLAQQLDYYLAEAEKNRLEIKVADLQIQIAEKELGLARKDFYPTLSLEGSYFRRSTKWDLEPQEDLLDPDGWSIIGVATWDFWQWGRTSYGEREKRSRLSQAKISRDQALFQIRLEVEQSYLKTRESEKNIVTIETAIEQAKENMRITEERYKEQAATSTDILIAQNLLFRTQTNFFNALYDFKIAKAFLQKSIGLEILE